MTEQKLVPAIEGHTHTYDSAVYRICEDNVHLFLYRLHEDTRHVKEPVIGDGHNAHLESTVVFHLDPSFPCPTGTMHGGEIQDSKLSDGDKVKFRMEYLRFALMNPGSWILHPENRFDRCNKRQIREEYDWWKMQWPDFVGGGVQKFRYIDLTVLAKDLQEKMPPDTVPPWPTGYHRVY